MQIMYNGEITKIYTTKHEEQNSGNPPTYSRNKSPRTSIEHRTHSDLYHEDERVNFHFNANLNADVHPCLHYSLIF